MSPVPPAPWPEHPWARIWTSAGGENWPRPRARAAADTVKHGVSWGRASPESLKFIWLGMRGRVFTSAVVLVYTELRST